MKRLTFTVVALSLFAGCIAAGSPASAGGDAKTSEMNLDSGAQERLSRIRNLPEAPSVRILICSDEESLEVEVPGACNIYNPKSGKKIEAAFLKTSYTMLPTQEGIRWGTDFPGIFQLLIIPDDTKTPVRVNGIDYPGAIYCYQIGSKLAVVNSISLEDFTSVLMSTTLLPKANDTKEGLAAYAIAFRTKGLWCALHPKNPFWDIQASTFGYRGKSVIRQDKLFQDGVRVTTRLVLQGNKSGSLAQTLDNDSLQQLLASMPSEEVSNLSKHGKNAKEILADIFPDAVLTVVPKPNDAIQPYLK